MSVGQFQSPKHLTFLQNEHNRQQDQLNKNILDRLQTLQSFKMKSFSPHQVSHSKSNTLNEEMKENIQEVANKNIDNLRKLEQSTRQYWEQLYDKMRNMENKMLRMFKDKQEAMTYLQLRISSTENSQRTVADMMRKLMDQQSQKYSGIILLEQRIKQMQHRFQLKDQKQSDNLKIFKEEMFLKIKSETNQRERGLQQARHQAINLPNKVQSDDGDMEELVEKVKMMQLELKQNKRKFITLEDKFGGLETDVEEMERKIKNIQKELQNIQDNIKNIPKNYQRESDFRIQEPVSRPQSANRREIGVRTADKKTSDQLPRSQFRGISHIRRESRQVSEESEDGDPFEQMNNMRGGIRGLLQKSKEKEQKPSHQSLPKPKATLAGLGTNQSIDEPRGLPRQKSLAPVNPLARGPQRGLPPVKADLKLKNQIQMHPPSQSQQEQQEQVYGVDEQGYLLDQQGNYIYNQYDERVQLSQQDFIELMRQQNG